MQQPLFETTQIGNIELKNRIVMAPMTRARTAQPGNIPTALMAEYYQQRASSGLIITEATQISPQGQGYSWTPGIHSAEQIAGWRLVTDAVHKVNGKIFSQLWHVGRMSHESFHTDGKLGFHDCNEQRRSMAKRGPHGDSTKYVSNCI